MTIDEAQALFVELWPAIWLALQIFALIIGGLLIIAILRTPKEIRKNRAVLLQILKALRSRDEPDNKS